MVLSAGTSRLTAFRNTDEFLITVALHAASGDFALECVEDSKQGSCAVEFAVVRHCTNPAFLQRQIGLSAIQHLDLELLVHAEDNGMGGRINIKTVDALGDNPFLPTPDYGFTDTGRAHDLRRAQAIGRGQDDRRARQTCFCGLLRLSTITSSRL